MLTGAVTAQPNGHGWYSTDVTVKFTATDPVSGLETVTPDVTLTIEGANQSVTGTATDRAGNTATFTVANINIDKTQPEITINIPTDGAQYSLREKVTAGWTAQDSLSGIDSATGTVPSGSAIDTATVGEKTFTVEVTDRAGNKTLKTVKYYVLQLRRSSTALKAGRQHSKGRHSPGEIQANRLKRQLCQYRHRQAVPGQNHRRSAGDRN
ncbi:MAG: hypothetical protein ACOY46_14255 [Bacillota bacterium]